MERVRTITMSPKRFKAIDNYINSLSENFELPDIIEGFRTGIILQTENDDVTSEDIETAHNDYLREMREYTQCSGLKVSLADFEKGCKFGIKYAIDKKLKKG
jgi:hypothetical protein